MTGEDLGRLGLLFNPPAGGQGVARTPEGIIMRLCVVRTDYRYEISHEDGDPGGLTNINEKKTGRKIVRGPWDYEGNPKSLTEAQLGLTTDVYPLGDFEVYPPAVGDTEYSYQLMELVDDELKFVKLLTPIEPEDMFEGVDEYD